MYAWNWNPQLVLGLIAQISAYLACVGPLRRYFPGSAPVARSQIQLFGLGWLSLFLALVSPVDTLASSLLTMHMAQHMLLTLVAPPLMLIGTPRWLFRPLLRIPGALALGRLATSFVAGFVVYNAVFALWHVPRFYEQALASEPIHILEHLSFFVTAALLWWPICSPLDELPAMPPGLQVIYLFLQSLPPTILGAILTFAAEPLYPSYERAPRLWGLDALTDQQLAGLLMWIPGSLVFFGVLTVIFIRWLNRDEYEPQSLAPEKG
ncbi:MAG TPA: cytochrome c oxidase assembly protein [Roseiflexaceae bacterium]|nr:cytochrome c oxidase assembly protein [Roseiflexaceae bacterium]